ncbi:MAG TPA: CheR family methyltransferase [Anaerolineales bacterium]|nr:CheR family methyltransferase [Anaerolineales bacterium]
MRPQEPPDLQFEALLDFLRFSRGFDFTGYKRSSLIRRVLKRRYTLSLASFADYLDYLQVHPDEFEHLFNTILINVTSFFRDKPAWDYLQTEIIQRILLNKGSVEPIRVWSAGCASGEEAYSLAMVFGEHLGIEEFHRRVKIYATDMDNDALVQARQATYSTEDVKDVPEEYRNRFFTRANTGDYIFNSDMRRSVIFGQHDLVQDAPISRLDLLVCRNTLMYFNAETQGRILARFHFALNNGGCLFLGKAEMLLSHANIFSALDVKHRFFTKVSRPDIRDHLLALGQIGDEQLSNRLVRLMRMRDLAFDSSPDAQLIIDVNGALVAANEKANNQFNLALKDVGSMLHDLEICYQPVGLRPLIDRVKAENQPLKVPEVELLSDDGKHTYLEVTILPLNDNGSHMIGISVTFTDISRSKTLEEQLKNSTTELETTNEELQSTNEELETTNEELQSTVEELETTNEELQSTNEELETMNEELQSTNEELETINDELTLRTNQLNTSKSFLETILGNMRLGVVVVDREFHIQNWNSMAEDLWGVRSDEIMGTSLLGLDIGLPVENLKRPVRAILDEKADIQDVVLKAINRRGKTIMCRVTCTPFTGGTKDRQGVVLVMEEESNGDQHAR